MVCLISLYMSPTAYSSCGGMMEVIPQSMFSCLQNCLNWSNMKFMPEFHTLYFRSPNSVKMILAAMINSSDDNTSAPSPLGTCCSHLQ